MNLSLSSLFGPLCKTLASRRIPSEAYGLIHEIKQRYLRLNFNPRGADMSLNDKEKLEWLIRYINQDHRIARLNALSEIGPILAFRHMCGIVPTTKIGLDLRIGSKGLFICHWSDDAGIHEEAPASSDNFRRFCIAMDCYVLRQAIVEYTDQDKYTQHVSECKMFKRSPTVRFQGSS